MREEENYGKGGAKAILVYEQSTPCWETRMSVIGCPVCRWLKQGCIFVCVKWDNH